MPSPPLNPLSALRHPIEIGLLSGMAVALPLFEAPKNILWGLYVIVWILNRARSRRWGGPWDRWDTLFAVWIASALGAAFFAGMHGNEWRGAHDLIRIASVLALVRRAGYGDSEGWTLALAVQVGVAVAVGWAFVDMARPHDYEGLELPSVGHVNHSAVYVTIAAGALLALTLALWSRATTGARAILVCANALYAIALFAAGSRAAAGIYVVLLVVMGVAWMHRLRRSAVWLALVAIAFVAIVVGFDAEMKKKNAAAAESTYPGLLNQRYPIWNLALEAWHAHPLFGIGLNNFRAVDRATAERWRSDRGQNTTSPLAVSSHAHSLYLNTLAERGVVGVAGLALLLGSIGIALLRSPPAARATDAEWMLWGSSVAALVTTLGVGLFNTTFHHEHGLLTVLLIALWLGRSRQGRGSAR